MNWKNKYTIFKNGDKVIAIKPCLECINEGINNCWNRWLKGEILTITGTNGNGKLCFKKTNGRNCSINKECLKKVK